MFAWLAFVITLKPEEVLGSGIFFSMFFGDENKHILCCGCTENVHPVSAQGAAFSTHGWCWSCNAVTEVVVGGFNLLGKKSN